MVSSMCIPQTVEKILIPYEVVVQRNLHVVSKKGSQ